VLVRNGPIDLVATGLAAPPLSTAPEPLSAASPASRPVPPPWTQRTLRAVGHYDAAATTRLDEARQREAARLDAVLKLHQQILRLELRQDLLVGITSGITGR